MSDNEPQEEEYWSSDYPPEGDDEDEDEDDAENGRALFEEGQDPIALLDRMRGATRSRRRRGSTDDDDEDEDEDDASDELQQQQQQEQQPYEILRAAAAARRRRAQAAAATTTTTAPPRTNTTTTRPALDLDALSSDRSADDDSGDWRATRSDLEADDSDDGGGGGRPAARRGRGRGRGGRGGATSGRGRGRGRSSTGTRGGLRRLLSRSAGAGGRGPGAAYRRVPEDAARMLGHANLLYAAGEHQRAADLLVEVVRLAPNLPDPYLTLGAIYEAAGDERRALDFYMLAAHLTPLRKRKRALIARGEEERDARRGAEAAAAAGDDEVGAGAGPSSAAARGFEEGEEEQEGEDDQEDLGGMADAEASALWKRLAALSARLGFLRQAGYCLSQALRADPRDLDARYDRAVLLAELGDHPLALRELERVRPKRPADPQLARALARLHHRMGAPEKAMRVLGELLSLHPDRADWGHVNLLAELHLQRGRPEDQALVLALVERAQALFSSPAPAPSPAAAAAAARQGQDDDGGGEGQQQRQPEGEEEEQQQHQHHEAAGAPLPLEVAVKAGQAVLALGGGRAAASAYLDQLLEWPVALYADLYLDAAHAYARAGMGEAAAPFLSALATGGGAGAGGGGDEAETEAAMAAGDDEDDQLPPRTALDDELSQGALGDPAVWAQVDALCCSPALGRADLAAALYRARWQALPARDPRLAEAALSLASALLRCGDPAGARAALADLDAALASGRAVLPGDEEDDEEDDDEEEQQEEQDENRQRQRRGLEEAEAARELNLDLLLRRSRLHLQMGDRAAFVAGLLPLVAAAVDGLEAEVATGAALEARREEERLPRAVVRALRRRRWRLRGGGGSGGAAGAAGGAESLRASVPPVDVAMDGAAAAEAAGTAAAAAAPADGTDNANANAAPLLFDAFEAERGAQAAQAAAGGPAGGARNRQKPHVVAAEAAAEAYLRRKVAAERQRRAERVAARRAELLGGRAAATGQGGGRRRGGSRGRSASRGPEDDEEEARMARSDEEEEAGEEEAGEDAADAQAADEDAALAAALAAAGEGLGWDLLTDDGCFGTVAELVTALLAMGRAAEAERLVGRLQALERARLSPLPAATRGPPAAARAEERRRRRQRERQLELLLAACRCADGRHSAAAPILRRLRATLPGSWAVGSLSAEAASAAAWAAACGGEGEGGSATAATNPSSSSARARSASAPPMAEGSSDEPDGGEVDDDEDDGANPAAAAPSGSRASAPTRPAAAGDAGAADALRRWARLSLAERDRRPQSLPTRMAVGHARGLLGDARGQVKEYLAVAARWLGGGGAAGVHLLPGGGGGGGRGDIGSQGDPSSSFSAPHQAEPLLMLCVGMAHVNLATGAFDAGAEEGGRKGGGDAAAAAAAAQQRLQELPPEADAAERYWAAAEAAEAVAAAAAAAAARGGAAGAAGAEGLPPPPLPSLSPLTRARDLLRAFAALHTYAAARGGSARAILPPAAKKEKDNEQQPDPLKAEIAGAARTAAAGADADERAAAAARAWRTAEAAYNLGRACHGVGLPHVAVSYYERALGLCGAGRSALGFGGRQPRGVGGGRRRSRSRTPAAAQRQRRHRSLEDDDDDDEDDDETAPHNGGGDAMDVDESDSEEEEEEEEPEEERRRREAAAAASVLAPPGRLDLSREAAHNLALLYRSSGADHLAREVLRRHLTV